MTLKRQSLIHPPSFLTFATHSIASPTLKRRTSAPAIHVCSLSDQELDLDASPEVGRRERDDPNVIRRQQGRPTPMYPPEEAVAHPAASSLQPHATKRHWLRNHKDIDHDKGGPLQLFSQLRPRADRAGKRTADGSKEQVKGKKMPEEPRVARKTRKGQSKRGKKRSERRTQSPSGAWRKPLANHVASPPTSDATQMTRAYQLYPSRSCQTPRSALDDGDTGPGDDQDTLSPLPGVMSRTGHPVGIVSRATGSVGSSFARSGRASLVRSRSGSRPRSGVSGSSGSNELAWASAVERKRDGGSGCQTNLTVPSFVVVKRRSGTRARNSVDWLNAGGGKLVKRERLPSVMQGENPAADSRSEMVHGSKKAQPPSISRASMSCAPNFAHYPPLHQVDAHNASTNGTIPADDRLSTQTASETSIPFSLGNDLPSTVNKNKYDMVTQEPNSQPFLEGPPGCRPRSLPIKPFNVDDFREGDADSETFDLEGFPDSGVVTLRGLKDAADDPSKKQVSRRPSIKDSGTKALVGSPSPPRLPRRFSRKHQLSCFRLKHSHGSTVTATSTDVSSLADSMSSTSLLDMGLNGGTASTLNPRFVLAPNRSVSLGNQSSRSVVESLGRLRNGCTTVAEELGGEPHHITSCLDEAQSQREVGMKNDGTLVAHSQEHVVNLYRDLLYSGDNTTEKDIQDQLRSLRLLILTHGIPDTRPHSLRPLIWKVLLEVLKVSASDYVALVRKGKSQVYDKIRNDTFRTLATDEVFRRRVNDSMLVRTLNAFAWKHAKATPASHQNPRNSSSDPTILKFSYVQGMNVLIAPFLYIMPEVDAFFAFEAFVKKHCPLYVQPTLEGVHCGLRLVDRCLEVIDRELWIGLGARGLGVEVWAFAPVMTFSASTPPLDEVIQLWDFLLAFGVHMNILCVIAQVLVMKEELLAHASPMKLLRTLPKLNATTIIAIVVSLVRKLPNDLYDLLVRHPYDPTVFDVLLRDSAPFNNAVSSPLGAGTARAKCRTPCSQ